MSTAAPAPAKTMAEKALEYGLKADEYQVILDRLGREPNDVELGVYSVMWSEHCSYKNSITQLKTLPRDGERLLVKAGEENAGLVDIGDGLGCVFKIESHNHPSAIEPFQGAATGVGGIHRDIFTMGARPIASLNSLRGSSGGGLNPLGTLRAATGIDRLRILGGDETTGRGTALAAGQYLTDDIYVEFITDARGFTATQLEVSLTPALSILSQAGGSGATNVNVRYRKNY